VRSSVCILTSASKDRRPCSRVLLVDRRLARTIDETVRRARPAEACGLLLADRGTDPPLATEFVVAASALARPGRFEIPDSELRRMRAWAEDRGLEIVALFHSHPSGDPRLSAPDRAAIRYSEWPWIVVTHDRHTGCSVLTGYATPDGAPIRIAIVSA
jgi:proteasome lid subunit RPN8/RPN11